MRPSYHPAAAQRCRSATRGNRRCRVQGCARENLRQTGAPTRRMDPSARTRSQKHWPESPSEKAAWHFASHTPRVASTLSRAREGGFREPYSDEQNYDTKEGRRRRKFGALLARATTPLCG